MKGISRYINNKEQENNENKKDENDEKNKYCWNACMDKDTDYYVIMYPIVIDDEDFMYCPQCNEAWEPDYEQIPHGMPHKEWMKALARHHRDKEKNPQDYWPDDDIQGGN